MVHAGSGQNEDARSRGTLVNALLYRFKKLSATGGELRPGIVHRLDKDTSGLIVVAKNDRTHAALGEMFASRQMKKTYIALVQGAVERQKGTINAGVGRDPVRRTRMTTKTTGKCALGGFALRGGAAAGDAVWQVHAGEGANRDRADAPDQGAHGVDRPPGGGRHALWRLGATDGPGGLAGGDSRRPRGARRSRKGCGWDEIFCTRHGWSSRIPGRVSCWNWRLRCRWSWRVFLAGWKAQTRAVASERTRKD